MRIAYLIALFLSINIGSSLAQSANLVMGRATTKETTNYDPAKEIEGALLFPTSFGKVTVTNARHAKLLSNVKPYRVELVYSKYPKTTNFQNIQQRRLNLARLQALGKIAPQLLRPDVEWEFVAHIVQTAAQARKLYHGFVVYYEVEGVEKVTEIKNIPDEPEEQPEKPEEPETPDITPDPVPTYSFDPKSEDAIFVKEGNPKTNTTYQVFDRQNWNNVVVVCDWTASMYHFATPVLLWHNQKNQEQDSSSILNFVFFNDGDGKATQEKKIGQTGGIYATKTGDIDEALALMESSKEAGSGGDFPENDIEALLYAQEQYPKAEALVLIADNMAAVRDISLLSKLNLPVHILISRTEKIDQIRTEYWDLAIQTEGTIHTLKEDISLDEAIAHKERLDELAALSKRELRKLERKEKRKIRRKKRGF